jgi:hypothetical protein
MKTSMGSGAPMARREALKALAFAPALGTGTSALAGKRKKPEAL